MATTPEQSIRLAAARVAQVAAKVEHDYLAFGHFVTTDQLAIGLAGVGIFSVGALMHRQRATNKFLTSLLSTSSIKLSGIRGYYPRHGAEHFDIFGANRSIAVVGSNRSGTSVFVSHNILYGMFPFWHRLFCPPRGLFLRGFYGHGTVKDWLKGELQVAGVARDEYPMRSINEFILQRYTEQPIRNFLKKVFEDRLPRVLQPQPTIIIVDDAEILLRRFRCDFLLTFSELVRHALDSGSLRLVFLVSRVPKGRAWQGMLRIC